MPAAPPAALRELAKARPNSWVYELDPSFQGSGSIPTQHIRRAWRTGPDGSIVADGWVENEQYRPGPATRSSHRRRAGRALVLIGLVVLLAGGSWLLVHHLASRHSAAARAAMPTAAAPRTAADAAARPPRAARPHHPKPAARQRVVKRASGAVGHRAPRERAPRSHAAPVAAISSGAVRLRLIATGRVWICVEDAGGRLDGRVLLPGASSPTYTSSAFRIFAGNHDIQVLVNGRVQGLPGFPAPLNYGVRASGLTPLSPAEREQCP